ncbi:MAG: hypothetical protein IJO98_01540 [Clostridia bacterium]|nr:hypothetical protein [Clostridia bacterium]
MKKFLALVMAMMMVLAMGTAFAATNDGSKMDASVDTNVIKITKVYKAANDDMTSPAETFNFTIENVSVTESSDVMTVSTMPTPEVGSITVGAGAATTAGATFELDVTLPKYDYVGIYTYKIQETNGHLAGVDYFGEDADTEYITLVVTVIEENGKKMIAAVHCENPVSPSYATDSKKTDRFENVYEAADITIGKTVTGQFGDQSKYFDVTVTLTGDASETYLPIAITGGTNSSNVKSIVVNGDSVVLKIKHGETITLENVPYDVQYTVVEADYTDNATVEENKLGYDAAIYNGDDINAASDKGTVDSASEDVEITNNKGGNIDTGITMDNAPYMMIMAMVVLAGAAMMMKRRAY